MDVLSAAARWAERGFRVFPTRGRAPMTKGADWRAVATADAGALFFLDWSGADGFGVALDRHFVVDLDAHEHPVEEAAQAFQAFAPDAPPTLTVRTPRGGYHLYFTAPEGVIFSQRSPAPGRVDVRVPGKGYVCGPGVGGYELVRDDDAQPLPASLVSFCRDTGPERVEDRTPVVELDQPEALAAAWDMLSRLPANEPSGEDAFRYKLACRLLDHGLSEEMAGRLLHRWNERLAAHPRAAEEIDKAVANAVRYARLPPGQRWHERQETIRALLTHANGGIEPEPTRPPTLSEVVTRRMQDAGLRLTARSIQDLTAMPPPRWFVPGWILAEGVTAIYGPPKRGKTFAALDLALAAAHGKPWLGQVPFVEVTGAVVYLCLERPAEAWARVLAWCEFHDLEPSENFLFIDGSAFLQDAEAVEALKSALAAIPQGVSLMVVDTLARAMLGAEEQSSREMGLAMASLEELGRGFSCPIVAVHHSGKDASRGMRGSSAILACVSAAISADMEDGKLTLCVHEISRGKSGATLTAVANDLQAEHPVFIPSASSEEAYVPRPEPVSQDVRLVTAVIAAAASEPEGGTARMVPMSDFLARFTATSRGIVPAAKVRMSLYWAMERFPSLRELVLAADGQAAVYPASQRGALARKAGVQVPAEGLTDPP